MRRLLLAALAVLFATSAFAGERPPRENILFFNPFTLIWGQWTAGLEHKTSENTSVVVGGHYQTPVTMRRDAPNEDITITGFGFYAQPHFYLGGRGAPRGPYLAPFGSYTKYTLTYEVSGDRDVSTTGLGATVGWSWMPGNSDRLNIKLGLGGAYYVNLDESTTQVEGVRTEGFGFAGDLKLGLAF